MLFRSIVVRSVGSPDRTRRKEQLFTLDVRLCEHDEGVMGMMGGNWFFRQKSEVKQKKPMSDDIGFFCGV
jgi:hypothetical protein